MGVRSKISETLRKAGLLEPVDKMRYWLHRIAYRGMNRRFLKEHSREKFPPPYFIYETYKLNYAEYFYDGQNTAEEIVITVTKHHSETEKGRWLDWGCGPGRIVRHLPSFLKEAAIHGTDYNARYIRWCKENIRNVKFKLNKVDPPLSYEDGFFSVVLSLSILTHLSEPSHKKWINEIHRVLEPEGIFYLTTQGVGASHKLLPQEKELFDKGEIVVRESGRSGHRLYSAFQPKGTMEKLITGKFVVLEFIEGGKDEQDTWILQKVLGNCLPRKNGG